MSKSSKDFLLTFLIAFVELHIKTHKSNFLMNNRRILIINAVKIIQKWQAWPTILDGSKQMLILGHFCQG